MSAPFVHLHVHSEYSILDGACRIPALAKKAAALEMPAVTLTDHGSMAGTVELFKAAKAEGVKPIVGCEVYVVDDRHKQHKGHAHLTLLAADQTGYSNLIKLCSLGYLEGYYYKPRVDWELLERYAPGMIALSGCLSGRVSRAISEGRERDAESELDRLAQIFGRDNTYVELQNAGLDIQQPVFNQLPGARPEAWPPARRDGRRPLPRRSRRVRARGAPLHPVGRLAQEPQPLEVRDERVLLQDAGGDGARLPGARGRDAAHARDRRPVQRRARVRSYPPAEVPGSRRSRCLRLPRRALREGDRPAVRRARRRSSTSGCGSSSRRCRRWASPTTS